LERLDKVLVSSGFYSSRSKAEEAILNQLIKVNSQIIDKPGKKINPLSKIEVIQLEKQYVSRGAFKLKQALTYFNLDVKNLKLMDLGASTGGFTEVLLENGCQIVYCVDVGTGQLNENLLNNDRVRNLEKTHIKNLTPEFIGEPLDGIVIDLSFISLTKVFHFLPKFLKDQSFVVALIKPQFEVGKNNLSKKGVVKNQNLYPQVISTIKKNAEETGFIWINACESPIKGGSGNIEFLCYLRKSASVDV
jgi:23S rRNA (cytidine1920-2'-O)/16S rRNA (cytidine1409-2'-O)-methyltransferase